MTTFAAQLCIVSSSLAGSARLRIISCAVAVGLGHGCKFLAGITVFAKFTKSSYTSANFNVNLSRSLRISVCSSVIRHAIYQYHQFFMQSCVINKRPSTSSHCCVCVDLYLEVSLHSALTRAITLVTSH